MDDAWLRPGMALVLDMDGVIVDSNPLHAAAWIEYNRRFGIDAGEALMERMYGRRNDEIVREFFGPQLIPRFDSRSLLEPGEPPHGLPADLVIDEQVLHRRVGAHMLPVHVEAAIFLVE